MLNTVVRRSPSTAFETLSTMTAKGELTSERIGEIWIEIQRRSLGPALRFRRRLSDLLGLHTAFHPLAVYAYAYASAIAW